MAATGKDLARDLASRALNAAMREEWSIAAAIVRRLHADCGPDGTMTAVVGWCDTLAARLGLDGERPVEVKFAARTEGEEPPARIQWAAQLFMARARLDKTSFDALIRMLPSSGKTQGSYVGAVLECVALTLKETPEPALTAGSCPACGSEVRAEHGLVPGFTGMPVTCGDEWHDEETGQESTP